MESYINPDDPSDYFTLPLLNPGRKYPELDNFDIDRNEHRFLREVFPWEGASYAIKDSHIDPDNPDIRVLDKITLLTFGPHVHGLGYIEWIDEPIEIDQSHWEALERNR